MNNLIVRCGAILVCFSLSFSDISIAGEITCGLKTVTVQGGKIVKIKHEDGTVHTGSSVSNNWTYDGKSIRHRLLGTPHACGTKPKSRNEVVESLSSRFTENPSYYGLTKDEGTAMQAYANKLMTSGEDCHLIVDGAKSTQREGMYYIDCNDKSGVTRRHWVSQNDLSKGRLRQAVAPISEGAAIEICSRELKARTMNPSTYDPALLTGTSIQTVESVGRSIVEIQFTAKNSFGVEGKYRGKCILESGSTVEVTIIEA